MSGGSRGVGSMPMGQAARMRQACEASLAALPGGAGSLAELDGARILASGATGFFGIWIHAALDALRAGGIESKLIRLERRPGAFDERCALWRGAPWAESVQAEAKSFGAASPGPFSHAMHMATSSDAAANAADPADMMLSTVLGTAGMLDLCERAGAKMLMVGSGAVYGRRRPSDGPSKESDASKSAPDPLDAKQCYGESKRAAEMLCAARSGGVHTAIARPFAFLGPHLPLSTHFAAGNFLRDASQGRAIVIKGDGTPVRSFMHPADLAAWLLWLMLHGPSGTAVNVGSDQAIALADLAEMVSLAAGSPASVVLGAPGGPVDYYVPDLARAKGFGLDSAHDLEFSIKSSIEWLSRSGGDWAAMPS